MKLPVMNLESTNVARTVYVFPRVRFREGNSRNERFSIGRIQVRPDENETWLTEFSRERPAWLRIFKRFATRTNQGNPEPAMGSILFADDDSWLEEHISRIVGVVSFLEGNVNNWRVPSEALVHVGFKLTDSQSDAVELVTKTHCLIEHADSVQLHPPLELRGVGSPFCLSLEKPAHQELVRRLDNNPFDHLVVACYHLYRTQWANFVHSPYEQDFAAFCASLEAAMNVRGQYTENITAGIIERYGDYPDLRDWVVGLYAERSVFNHGLNESVNPQSADYRIRALYHFRKRPQNWIVLREICSDIILRTLEPYESPTLKHWMQGFNRGDTMLRQLMLSDEVWSSLARRFLQSKAIEKICSLSDSERDDWINLAKRFRECHDWRYVTPPVETTRVLRVLGIVAAAAGMRAQQQGNTHRDSVCLPLLNAAKAGQLSVIRAWYGDRLQEGLHSLRIETVDDALFVIAIQLASYSWQAE